MLFVRTPLQFYAVRFLLGMSEAGFFPGVIFYLMQWFPHELRARAISRFYISLPLSSVFMGLIAGALLNLDGRLGLRGWQWLFLVEGLPAVLLGIAFFLFLPDGPSDAKWLTEDERHWIVRQVGQTPSKSTRHDESISAALLDPRVWQLGIFMLLMLASLYAYTFIAPDLIQRSTQLSTTVVGFILAGLSVLGALGMLFNAIHSDRMRERYWHVIPCCLFMSLGFFVCGVSIRSLIVVPALGLLILAYNSMQGPLWSLPANFLKGRSGAAGIAAINMIGIIGGFLGPYFIGFAKDLTGDYQKGLRLMALPMLLGAAIMLYLRREARHNPVR
jgi:ACS family tartrate transporter-like MFS transporter